MGILRRSQPPSDSVDAVSRLEGYEVTTTEGLAGGYASGYVFAAAPAAPSPHSTQILAPDDAPTDRRGAPRYPLQVPVRATTQADEPWQHGTTVDASLTGLCIDMGARPEIGFLDVEIDAAETIAAWARVAAWTELDDGRFRWRLRLVRYDPGYAALLDGLVPIETGFAPAPTDRDAEPAPSDDRHLVALDGGWGSLLDRPTA
jgi:hypothetical protein